MSDRRGRSLRSSQSTGKPYTGRREAGSRYSSEDGGRIRGLGSSGGSRLATQRSEEVVSVKSGKLRRNIPGFMELGYRPAKSSVCLVFGCQE